MHVFVYSKTGHNALLRYMNACGGCVISTENDSAGGTLSVFPNATAGDVALLSGDPTLIVLSSIECDDPLTGDMSAALALHPKHGITKGDTLRQALKKVRAARNGDPYFLPP